MHSRHLGGLDIVRFFAAMCVTFYHLGALSWTPVGLNYQLPGAPQFYELAWLGIGWIGVETFFVLSGFVISESAESSSAYKFFRGRMGRLFPGVILCATITLMVVLFFELQPLKSAAILYIKTLVFDPRGPWIEALYWTLSIETTFYGLIFLLLATNQFKKIELLAWTLASSSAVYLVGRSFFGLREISLLLQHGCFFALGIFSLDSLHGIGFGDCCGMFGN